LIGFDSLFTSSKNKMATKVQEVLRTMWRNGQPIDRYCMLGVGTGTVVGIGTGVGCVFRYSKPGEAAVTGVLAGTMATVAWPVAWAWVALYLPLKVLVKAVSTA